FGPSTIRDGLSKPVDFSTDPIYFVDEDDVRWKLIGLQAVDTRSNLFETEQVVNDAAIDKYSFIRDTWLQRREIAINDGNLPRDGNSNSGAKSLRDLELEDFAE
ncbi:MAG: MlaA family lipoprotein, partial [Burkholderiales bacterium]